MTCIPDEAQQEIVDILKGAADFLEPKGIEMMEAMTLILRIERLVLNGHIPLPCTLTVAAKFLGSYDASGLLPKGTDER